MKTTHSGIRAYKCHVCSKCFVTTSHLRRHIKSHSGIKPYVCDICMRAFPCQQNLKRHIKIHTGEKPYACPTCERAFLTLENLNRHIRIHTGGWFSYNLNNLTPKRLLYFALKNLTTLNVLHTLPNYVQGTFYEYLYIITYR